MGTEDNRTGRQQARFGFSYRESEPDPPDQAQLEGDADMREFVRQIGQWDWEQQGAAGNDLTGCCDADIRSIADLMERARHFFVDENDYPDEVVRIPFDKLAALVVAGNWSFVGGDFMEFEGNHNDTEITVVLEKASGS